MKKLLVILISIIGFHGKAQDFLDISADADYERIYVEAGFLQPIGKLSKQFEMSPSFGFWFRNKINKEDFVDLGFNFFIPKNPAEPNFKYQDSVVKYKSKYFGINIGTRFSKVIPFSQKSTDFNAELNSGIGLALNVYSAPNDLQFKKGEHSGEVLTTFFLSQGIKINYKNVGLQCHYQWSPYGLFNEKLAKDYGSQTLIFGVVYRQ